MIIDSGYLLYGKTATYVERCDIKLSNLLFAMEGKDSIRKQRYPQYKAHRVSNDTSRYVAELRTLMQNRFPRLYTIKGFEADDVIALYVYLTGDNCVIGVDKDLLQIPSINLTFDKKDVGMVNKTLFNSPNLVGKTLYQYLESPLNPYQWLLYLTLIGDKSDNIPRLVDKLHYGYQQIGEILLSDKPFDTSRGLYGENFLRNLCLVLLPHPELLSIPLSDVIDILDHFIINLPNENWLDASMVRPNVVEYILSVPKEKVIPRFRNEEKFYKDYPTLYKYLIGLT